MRSRPLTMAYGLVAFGAAACLATGSFLWQSSFELFDMRAYTHERGEMALHQATDALTLLRLFQGLAVLAIVLFGAWLFTTWRALRAMLPEQRPLHPGLALGLLVVPVIGPLLATVSLCMMLDYGLARRCLAVRAPTVLTVAACLVGAYTPVLFLPRTILCMAGVGPLVWIAAMVGIDRARDALAAVTSPPAP